MLPDQALLARDLGAPRVVAGVDAGKWRIIRHEFPNLVFSVSAEVGQGRAAVCLMFRCQCDGYPGQTPYVELWDNVRRARPATPRP